MISNLALDNCTLERKEDITYLVTPDKTINCELVIPPEYISHFQNRHLLAEEIAVIQRLRDSGNYTSLDQPFKEAPNFSVGKLIALFVARNNNCITVNENEDHDIPVEYKWSAMSNGLQRVQIGGIYDMVTNNGVATVMVIEKFEDGELVPAYEKVKVFVLSNVYYSVSGTDRYIQQLSKVNVDSRNLVKKGHFFFN